MTPRWRGKARAARLLHRVCLSLFCRAVSLSLPSLSLSVLPTGLPACLPASAVRGFSLLVPLWSSLWLAPEALSIISRPAPSRISYRPTGSSSPPILKKIVSVVCVCLS